MKATTCIMAFMPIMGALSAQLAMVPVQKAYAAPLDYQSMPEAPVQVRDEETLSARNAEKEEEEEEEEEEFLPLLFGGLSMLSGLKGKGHKRDEEEALLAARSEEEEEFLPLLLGGLSLLKGKAKGKRDEEAITLAARDEEEEEFLPLLLSGLSMLKGKSHKRDEGGISARDIDRILARDEEFLGFLLKPAMKLLGMGHHKRDVDSLPAEKETATSSEAKFVKHRSHEDYRGKKGKHHKSSKGKSHKGKAHKKPKYEKVSENKDQKISAE